MTTDATPEPRTRWAGLLILVGIMIWLAFLFFQRGQPWDEAEHAHAAWLMSRGQRPLQDFFQHHQPLLWNLLELYFRAGFTGPAVLIWGRLIVLACALVSVLSLAALGARLRNVPGRNAAWFGVSTFIGCTILLPALFVVRPETLSMALFLIALAMWTREPSSWWALLAGVAVGAGIYASPRFLLCAGLFLLLGTQNLLRWLSFAAGALAFVAIYTFIADYSLENVVFNVRFSAHLQTVSDLQYGYAFDFGLNLLTAIAFPMTVLVIADPHERWRGAALLAYGLIITLVCGRLAGDFHYAQAYAPAVLALTVAGTSAGARVPRSGMVAALALCPLAAIGFQLRLPHFDLLDSIAARTALAQSVPAGERMLIFAGRSPITVDDASYYGTPIWDGRDRLCQAVRTFHSRVALPPCDFLQTLKAERPFLTDSEIDRAVPAAEAGEAARLIASGYCQPVLVHRSWRYLRGAVQRVADLADPVCALSRSRSR